MNANPPTPGTYDAIVGLIGEIKKCEEHGLYRAALALCFVTIDTFAFLSAPEGQAGTSKRIFIEWVDRHLKGHPSQTYQYRGVDVYAARCAVLHTWGVEAEMHRQDPSVMMFGYSNGGQHLYNPNVNTRLVIIGLKSFINDFVTGATNFMESALADESLMRRMHARVDSVMTVGPAKGRK